MDINVQNEFIEKYRMIGSDKFYRFLLSYAVNKLVLLKQDNYLGLSPELEYLDYADKFLFSYRRSGNPDLINISKLFRKSAHRVYRLMLKQNLTSHNMKFLNLVSYGSH